jgi:hypothetical protein
MHHEKFTQSDMESYAQRVQAGTVLVNRQVEIHIELKPSLGFLK